MAVDNKIMGPCSGWLPDEFKGLEPVKFIHGADVTWRRVVQPAGPGYFIVGDAAAVLDPASSHGVLKGIMSGMKAAHAIIRICKDGFPNEIASKNYNEWITKWFLYDIQKLKKLYSQYPFQPAWYDIY
jgi:flavin-dependent dehydrogenase